MVILRRIHMTLSMFVRDPALAQPRIRNQMAISDVIRPYTLSSFIHKCISYGRSGRCRQAEEGPYNNEYLTSAVPHLDLGEVQYTVLSEQYCGNEHFGFAKTSVNY